MSDTATSPLVSARAATVTWPGGRTGIEEVDFDVYAGRVAVLLGPNGSGKTTLLRILSGDLTPRAGAVDRQTDERAGIGYATDASAHFDELSGRENAHWFARATGGADEAADVLLDRLGLAADADVPAGEYSFGMRRKVILAEALAHEPGLILLDEPTIGLDPAGTTALGEILRERAADGAAIVIATNDTRLAATADHVAFLHRGRIVASGSPARLLESVRGVTRIEVALETPLPEPPAMPAGCTLSGGDDTLAIDSINGTADLPALCTAIDGAGGRIRRIDVREPGFEEIFRQLTGEALRGESATADEANAAEPRNARSRLRSRRERGRSP